MKRLKEIWDNREVLLNANYDKFNDELVLLMKDPSSGEKKIYSLYEIEIPIYVAKKKQKWHSVDIDKNEVELRYVKNKFREWNIAKELGMKSFSKMVKEKKITPDQIYLNRNLFNADLGVEEYVIRDYVQHYAKMDGSVLVTEVPVVEKFHIGVFDIESDIRIPKTVDDDKHAHPINMISYVDGKDYTCFSGCLINPEYKGQKEVMEDLPGFKKKMKDFLIKYLDDIDIDEINPDKKKAKESSIKKLIQEVIDNITFDIKFYEKEEDMLIESNQHIFSEKVPDFLLAYNTKYDIGEQCKRCEEFNIPIERLFQYKDTPFRHYFNYKNDTFEVIKRFHDYYTRNMTKILDYYLLYYQLRRQNRYGRQSLDATAKRELGVGKLDFSHICNWIGDLPYEDFATFLMYNIMDNISLLLLERVTNDVFMATYTRFDNQTEWFNVFRPMEGVIGTFNGLKLMSGHIPGNNINKILINFTATQMKDLKERDECLYRVAKQLKDANVDKKDRDKNPYKVTGGFVSDPNGISKKIKKNSIYTFSPKNYNKFINCADDDATEMYPSNNKANNSSKTTMYGVISSIGGDNNKDLPHLTAMSLINQNYCNIGKYLFGLPDTEEMIKEYYGIERKSFRKLEKVDNFCDEPVIFYPSDNKKERNSLKRLWKSMYRTKYNETDQGVGLPSINDIFISDDSNYITLSYYSTKVELNLRGEETFNRLMGIAGKGFICGKITAKDCSITNYNDDYLRFMVPKSEKEPIIGQVATGVLTQTELDNLTQAKIRPTILSFGDIKLHTLNRVIFWNNMNCSPISYEVFNSKGDDEFLVKLYSTYEKDGVIVDITQSIVVYNMEELEN